MKSVSFKSRSLNLAANLYLPEGFDETRRYPAIVLSTPGSSVKEQVGAIYSAEMAAGGFVALTFDPSYQGASGGAPRDLEVPSVRVEDLSAALDYLTTLPFVDENRIGLLGVCAGGSYAINSDLTEHRFRSVGTVVATDMGRAFRGMQTPEGLREMLAEVGRQRTATARGKGERRDPWIPDSLQEAKKQGVTDQGVLKAVTFYREAHRHPGSTNRILYSSYGQILRFDAFAHVPELLIQPLQVIVGGDRGNTGQYEDGERLFAMSPATDKDFFVVEGAGHYDMYDQPQYVTPAVEKLASFFSKHLVA